MSKIGVKLFASEGEDIPLPELIPVFHRLLRDASLSGTFIDVADYSHVPMGPGVMLIGHEGNLSIDDLGARRGLRYVSKRTSDRGLTGALFAVLRCLLEAAIELEREPPPGRALKLATDTLRLYANDRLAMPNDERGRAALEVAAAALGSIYGAGATYSVAHNEDSRELAELTLSWSTSPSCSELYERLQASAAPSPVYRVVGPASAGHLGGTASG